MKKEKGISMLAFLVIVIIIIAAVFFWFKYFSEPMTTVVTGGAQQSLPALDKAKKARDTINKATQAREEAARKANEGVGN
ncbi:MAG: hypothetical protein A2031_08340 [Deltaproteobacteria bacterium RBG_19FT_COMBO_43_11]|nr:MAG: hypothetical protein A2031_08340 [Deltaproteobacteria bacterium RBG_19FT_COMBO_43_11]